MKKLGFICLFYGADYLPYAIKSIYNHVDKILIGYTNRPSHQQVRIKPIESRRLLYNLAMSVDPDNKIIWKEGTYKSEGDHRNMATEYGTRHGYDYLYVCDADEVYNPNVITKLPEYLSNNHGRFTLIKMIHFWKSFDRICTDAMSQQRCINLKADNSVTQYFTDIEPLIYHFGYARSNKDVAYKIRLHGHMAEWKPNWFENTYKNWNGQGDVHPTCKNTWTPEPFDKSKLPDFMHSHPYFGLDTIP